jgi:hypothetical protein
MRSSKRHSGDFPEKEYRVSSTNVTHQIAVQRLRAAGATIVADELAAFRNVDGNLGGWDGWAKGKYSLRVIGIIWPEQTDALRS